LDILSIFESHKNAVYLSTPKMFAMKTITLAILSCSAFFITALSQTTDTIREETEINGVWKNTQLEIITRNADCAFSSVLQLVWSDLSRSWVNAFLSTYHYDASGSSKTLVQSWNASKNDWTNYARSFLINHDSGMTYKYQLWDGSSNAWIDSYRDIQYRDKQGGRLLDEFDLSSNNQWQKLQRTYLTYDANDRVVKNFFQLWTNNGWTNNYRITYDYTGNGTTMIDLWANNDWVKFGRTFNQYIEGTALATAFRQQNLSDAVWQNTFRGQTSYNQDGSPLSAIIQSWDMSSNAWINNTRVLSDYYADGNPKRITYEASYDNEWNDGYRLTFTDVSCQASVRIAPVDEINKNPQDLVPEEL